jgi:hypothetical protein
VLSNESVVFGWWSRATLISLVAIGGLSADIMLESF